MDFASCIKKTIEENINIEINKKELLKKGYTLIKKNEKTKKIEFFENESTKEKRRKVNNDILFRNYENMINNWNNFRENDIELCGDRSRFLNYINEINKIIKEELELEELMKEANYEKEYEYSSDEENNKNLIY